ncbi:MAG: hypothetical protein EXQ88_05560 [Alphaproteobacteria bacterium]|nr:hypothetical protein [Alphaproteobacteria bacterium]
MLARCKFPWRAGAITGLTAALLFAAPSEAQVPHVAVTSIVELSSLDAIRDGLRDGLGAAGFAAGRGLRFDYASARADLRAAAAIVRRFAEENATVIVAISTPSAQAALEVAPQAPVMFIGTEPPVRTAGADGNALPPNFTGLTLPLPGANTLKLMQEFMPGLRRVALLRGPASARSDRAEADLRQAAAALGWQFESRTLARAEEARAVVGALTAIADAFIVANDPQVATAMPQIVAIAEAKLRPLFSLSSELVPRGAVAALDYDNYRVGQQAAGVVLRLLRGEPAQAIPVMPATADKITVNIDAAERTGTKVPQAVLARASAIVD